MDHLDRLESQSIYIFREARALVPRLGMLWSLGKDSNVMVWLARKAFYGKLPFPVMHIDTGRKFPEMLDDSLITINRSNMSAFDNTSFVVP